VVVVAVEEVVAKEVVIAAVQVLLELDIDTSSTITNPLFP
jgi:hypothetical protein